MTINLLVDANRDGQVTLDETSCDRWTWGPSGSGAIMFVNNDRDRDDTQGDSEYVEVMIAPPGPLPTGHSLRLSTISEDVAKTFALFSVDSQTGARKLVLGMDEKQTRRFPVARSTPLDVDPASGLRLAITGWRYPDGEFDGFVPLTLHLVEDGSGITIESSRVVLRVAPWLMLGHSQAAVKVYASDSSSRDELSNSAFLTALKDVLDTQSPPVPLVIAEKPLIRGDRWMQDELEIGYTMGPSHAFPVVFDLPRDRGLDTFPETLQEPNFGWFSLPRSAGSSSLDYGGNLEATPPFRAHGVDYPLGRIVYGSGKRFGYPGDIMPTMRSFLEAQLVQEPIELFTDWLNVGHIDEVISFIPCPNLRGFVVASSSVRAAKQILEDMERQGLGAAIMFEQKLRYKFFSDGSYTTSPADITVSDLLGDTNFWRLNDVYEKYQEQNELILQRELDLTPEEIVHIPSLFHPSGARTVAYFPGMVNSLVLGGDSTAIIAPKPFGPKNAQGEDVFEKAYSALLGWMTPHFIDDWSSYHELSGEVHCGSNTLRELPTQPWWECQPPKAFNYT